MSPVKYGVDGNVATITLADDENRNALGNALIEGIYNALHTAIEDQTTNNSLTQAMLFHTGQNHTV